MRPILIFSYVLAYLLRIFKEYIYGNAGVVMGLTVPVVYVKYEDRIKDVGQRVRVRGHTYYSTVTEKCRTYYSVVTERVKKMKNKLLEKKKKKAE